MNIITFRLHTQFNSIFPVVKIISEWLPLRAVFLLCSTRLLAASRGEVPEGEGGGGRGGGEEDEEAKLGMTEVI